MGAAIFPETSKYGGGPEKMAMVSVRQRWRRCLWEKRSERREATRLDRWCRPRDWGANVAARVQLARRSRLLGGLRTFFKMRNFDLDVVLAAFHRPALGGAAVGGGAQFQRSSAAVVG